MKDKKGEMPEHEKDAKMSVLEHVRQMAQDMMKDKLDGGMKKVSVASSSKEGLKEGLDKAREMMGNNESEDGMMHGDEHGDLESEESGESPMHEASESAEEEMSEHEEGHEDEEDMSEEELDKKLAELMAKKKKMESKKSM